MSSDQDSDSSQSALVGETRTSPDAGPTLTRGGAGQVDMQSWRGGPARGRADGSREPEPRRLAGRLWALARPRADLTMAFVAESLVPV